MAIIYTYPRLTDPDGTELVVVSETSNQNATRLIALSDIAALVPSTAGGTVTAVTLDFDPATGDTGLRLAGGVSTQTINTFGTFEVGGTLNADFGGTGQNTYTQGDMLYYDATPASLEKLTFASAPVGNGDVLTLAGGLPTWATPAAPGVGTVTSVGATNAMGISSGITFVTNPIPITGAGTVDLSFAGVIGDILYADTATTLAKLPATTAKYVLTSGGAGIAPSWDAAYATFTSAQSAPDTANVNLIVTETDASTDIVKLVAGTNITLVDDGANNVTINSSGGGNGIYGGSGSLIVNPTTVTMATNDLTWAGEHDTRILYDKVPRTSHVNSSFVVEVHQESDIPSPLAANTTYLVRGEVTLTTQKLVTNSGCSIIGVDRNRDKLIWTGEGPMLIITDVDFDLSDIWLSSTLPGSSLIQATNLNIAAAYNQGRNKVLTITNCQIRNCYDIMDVTGFDLVDINNTLFFYVQATAFGVRFASTSKIEISSCELIRWFDEATLPTPAGYSTASMIEILANAEGASGIGAINISGCIIHPQQTQVGVNINTGSTTGYGTIASNTFVDTGLTTGEVFLGDALTPAAGAYSEAECLTYDIFSNQGLRNSTAYILSDFSGNVTETVVAVAGTFVALNTGALAATTNSQRWTVSTAGLFTYIGTKEIYEGFALNVAFDKTAAGNDDYEFRVYKNGVAVASTAAVVNIDRPDALTMVYGDTVTLNDTFQIYLTNLDTTDNLLVTGWHCLLKE